MMMMIMGPFSWDQKRPAETANIISGSLGDKKYRSHHGPFSIFRSPY